jgi:hypothetical protein
MPHPLRLLALIGLVTAGFSGLLSGCDSAAPMPTGVPTSQPERSYPGYIVTPDPTQAPSPLSVSGPPFHIDGPLIEGATSVTGKGPKNIPIIVADITLNGQELARVVINSEGQFSASLSEPLNRGDRIGIVVGPLEDKVANNFDFMTKLYELHGTGYMYIPNLAHVYDSALVEARN